MNLIIFISNRYINNPTGYPIGDELRRPIKLGGIDRRAEFQKDDFKIRKGNFDKADTKSQNNAQTILEISKSNSLKKVKNNNIENNYFISK